MILTNYRSRSETFDLYSFTQRISGVFCVSWFTLLKVTCHFIKSPTMEWPVKHSVCSELTLTYRFRVISNLEIHLSYNLRLK